jgi:F-type H+-transporting ATPase subunit epsilon
MASAESPATFRLVVRTPSGTIVDEQVASLAAEDVTGRFGVRPRCEPLLAALLPGLLSYRRSDGLEVFVAVGKGLLDTQATVTRVAVREAFVCGSIDELESSIERAGRVRYEEEASLRQIFQGVYKHLLTAMVEEERRS